GIVVAAREVAARVNHDHQGRANRQRRQGRRVGTFHGHSHREHEKKRTNKLNNVLRNRHWVLLVTRPKRLCYLEPGFHDQEDTQNFSARATMPWGTLDTSLMTTLSEHDSATD